MVADNYWGGCCPNPSWLTKGCVSMQVQEDEAVVLKQYSLIDVGQLPCIFYINHRAVARVLLRSTRNYCLTY